jgi:hypothetical protein
MTKSNKNKILTGLIASGILLGTPASAEGIDTFFNEGKASGNVRLRFESADQSGVNSSEAFTIRNRIGFQSGEVNGFKAFIELEDIRLLNNSSDVNLAGSNPSGAGKVNIPDPETTELNKAWLSYSFEGTSFKVGRAKIILDDARFIGNVGWRQNEQTYDSVSITSSPVENLNIFGAYVAKTHRIFGDAQGSLPDFEGDSFLFNASYLFSKSFKLTGYAYLLELENAVNGASFSGSGDTFGIRATGSLPIQEDFSLSYSASYATQGDNNGSPTAGARSDFSLGYYALDMKLAKGATFIGAGFEVLEGDACVSGMGRCIPRKRGFRGRSWWGCSGLLSECWLQNPCR